MDLFERSAWFGHGGRHGRGNGPAVPVGGKAKGQGFGVPGRGSVKMCGGRCRACRVWQANMAGGSLLNMRKGFICKLLRFQARSLLVRGGWSLRRKLKSVVSAARGRMTCKLCIGLSLQVMIHACLSAARSFCIWVRA